jgi:hypothetical protein
VEIFVEYVRRRGAWLFLFALGLVGGGAVEDGMGQSGDVGWVAEVVEEDEGASSIASGRVEGDSRHKGLVCGDGATLVHLRQSFKGRT